MGSGRSSDVFGTAAPPGPIAPPHLSPRVADAEFGLGGARELMRTGGKASPRVGTFSGALLLRDFGTSPETAFTVETNGGRFDSLRGAMTR